MPEPDSPLPLDPPLVEEVDRGRRRELTDVGAGREGPLTAAEDDAADRLVSVELGQHRDKLVHQLVRERIQRLRPVEQDDRDRVVALEEN